MNHDVGCDVAVVGGGVSGLATAWHLHKHGIDVRLLEEKSEVGGVVRTEHRDGFVLEKGPFNVIVRSPSFESLLADFAAMAPVVPAARSARNRFIYRGGKLHVIRTSPWGLITTSLLSTKAKLRLARGMIISRRRPADEETIYQATSRRFGSEVAETMVGAFAAGIFGGDIHRLSFESCFPIAARLDRLVRSPIGYAMLSRIKAALRKPLTRGLISIEGGLGTLMATIGERLGSDLFAGHRTRSIRKATDGYEIDAITDGGESKTIQCRRLVLAVSAPDVARLLHSLSPPAAALIASIQSSSLAVLNIGVRAADVGHSLDGYGFLVPQNEPAFPLIGVLWADSVFPHHAPAGHRLIRAFFGGSRDASAVQRADNDLIASALTALRDVLHLRCDPVLTDVCRYPHAIPQYHLGHREKMKRLNAALATEPNLSLIGNYIRGVSINDTIDLAVSTAERLQHELNKRSDDRRERPEFALPTSIH
jgi:protoporphyrinogen/coproporphyrinogen III oxidase